MVVRMRAGAVWWRRFAAVVSNFDVTIVTTKRKHSCVEFWIARYDVGIPTPTIIPSAKS